MIAKKKNLVHAQKILIIKGGLYSSIPIISFLFVVFCFVCFIEEFKYVHAPHVHMHF